MAYHKSPWTDENAKILEKLWKKGFSASEIAKELGCGISRNAVIGKAHRMGLSDISRISRKKPIKRKKRVSNIPKQRKTSNLTACFHKPEAFFKEIMPRDIIPIPVRPLENPIPIQTLRDDLSQCRHPEGDRAPYKFCGLPTEGEPYCEYHKNLNSYKAGRR